MTGLTIGSLCSGYGGLDMAVEHFFGARTAWFAEYEDAPSRVLAKHWPGVPNHGDMTAIDWAAVETVDIIAGGTPCQDLSAAGKRRGMTEGTRSNLWVQMREAVATIRPSIVIWENVRGAFSAYAASDVESEPGLLGETFGPDRPALRGLGRVLGDLSDLGYDAEWVGVRASDVGAPHGRFRVFVVAYTRRLHGESWWSAGSGEASGGWSSAVAAGRHLRATADAGDATNHGERSRPGFGLGGEEAPANAARVAGSVEDGDSGPLANAGGGGRDGWSRTPGWEAVERTAPQGRREASTDAGRVSGELGRDAGDVDGSTRPGESSWDQRERDGDAAEHRSATDWGEYEPAIRRWERVLGRVAPAPIEAGAARNGSRRLSPRFEEWMMGLPDRWVTDPALELTWGEQVKMLGNGVVPQQALHAFLILWPRVIEQIGVAA